MYCSLDEGLAIAVDYDLSAVRANRIPTVFEVEAS